MNLPDSWPRRLRGRLYTQFQAAPWAVSLADAIGAQQDAIQAVQVALLSLWSIDPITDDTGSAAYGVGRGVQLDRIGRLVGQPRSGSDDEHFRYYLRARIAANRSNGTVDNLIRVFQAMLGPTELPFYTPGGNASFTLQLSTPMTDAVADIALYFLRLAKMAGVRALLETQEFVDSLMFFTSEASYVASAVSIGDGSIQVEDASAFPTSGTLIIDEGTADEETIAYTSRNATVFTVPSLTTAAHSNGAAVALVESDGLGFPVATYLTNPGSISDTTLDVVDEAGFAADDQILIDEGLANEETVTVTSTGAGVINCTGLTQNHEAGAAVVLVGSGGSLERVAQA